jgi:hypothetical protein
MIKGFEMKQSWLVQGAETDLFHPALMFLSLAKMVPHLLHSSLLLVRVVDIKD